MTVSAPSWLQFITGARERLLRRLLGNGAGPKLLGTVSGGGLAGGASSGIAAPAPLSHSHGVHG